MELIVVLCIVGLWLLPSLIGVILMAQVADVQAKQAELDASVQALADRIANQPKPAATEADLDGFVSALDATKQHVDSLVQ